MKLRDIVNLFDSEQPVRLMIREGRLVFCTEPDAANKLYSDLGLLGGRDVENIEVTGYVTIELQ